MEPDLLTGIAVGAALVCAAVVVLVLGRASRRRSLASVAGLAGSAAFGGAQPPPTIEPRRSAARRLGGAEWIAAGPSLEALGLAKLDAETYWSRSLFVSIDVKEATLQGRLEGASDGGAFEAFLGASAALQPGQGGSTALERFVAGEVGQLLGALPPATRLTLKAPEMPGDKHVILVEAPFCSPDGPSVVARVLMHLDEVALRPAAAGAAANLPPIVRAWREAGASLEAIGLRKLDAETYMRHMGFYVSVDVPRASLWGRAEGSCAGGSLEPFLGTEAELQPGEQGRSDLARFVAGEVREILGALPRAARLTVKAPEMPGDKHLIELTTPFTSPDQAALVARVLLALEEASSRPAPAGAAAPLPPSAAMWLAAGPSLEALGLRKLDAETYMARMDFFVNVDVRAAAVTGWLEGSTPGGALEQFLGKDAELRPGGGARSELAHFVAGQVAELLGALPRGASVTVKAPEIPGDKYKMRVETPFSAPEQAATVARLLLRLDEIARQPAR
ncbi:MAG TPA: hypothetical protein VGG39_20295 [Polyangiaceae bacterium]|jgi:hypothetical protein